MSATARLYAGVLMIGAWLGLLLFGLALRGAVHLVLAAALVAMPWRELISAREPAPLSAEGDARAPRAPDAGGDRS